MAPDERFDKASKAVKRGQRAARRPAATASASTFSLAIRQAPARSPAAAAATSTEPQAPGQALAASGSTLAAALQASREGILARRDERRRRRARPRVPRTRRRNPSPPPTTPEETEVMEMEVDRVIGEEERERREREEALVPEYVGVREEEGEGPTHMEVMEARWERQIRGEEVEDTPVWDYELEQEQEGEDD